RTGSISVDFKNAITYLPEGLVRVQTQERDSSHYYSADILPTHGLLADRATPFWGRIRLSPYGYLTNVKVC
ncbi:MAG: hypothetical protein KAS54_08675, partial [Dehalococcoidia bacterium]|nr:hypothetical protein [Dehalococcoidia bacterium]